MTEEKKQWGNGPENKLVWVDLETSGLSPTDDQILEIAIVITDWDLQEIAEPFSRVVRPAQGTNYNSECVVFPKMHRRVIEMHAKSGLLTAVGNTGDDDWTSVVESQARDYLADNGASGGPIAGASPHFDMSFLRYHMPHLAQCFDHRCFDVSTLVQAHRMWIGSLPKDEPRHRALDDIRGSILRAREMRRLLGIVESKSATRRDAVRKACEAKLDRFTTSDPMEAPPDLESPF
jgi:oligoribonuclease